MIKAGGVTGAILAALLCCALAPTGAGAAEVAFGSPQHLAGPVALDAKVRVDGEDRATIAWHEISDDRNWLLVKAMRARPGEPPGPVRTLAAWPNYWYPQGCVCPQLAVDPAGRATVAWLAFDGEDLRVRAIQLGADGLPIGPVKTLSPPGEDAGNPKLAMDPQGRATIAWQIGSSPIRTESARLLPDGSSEPAQTISEPGVSTQPEDIAVDAQGRASVTLATDGVELARIGADGVPTEVLRLSPVEEEAGAAQIAVDSQGVATVAWMRFGSAWEALGRRVEPDGTLGPVQMLTQPGEEALEPRPAVGPDDHVSVVWSTFTTYQIRLVRLDASGTPGPARLLSDPSRTSGRPQIVPLGDDTDLVVWAHTIVGGLIPAPGECIGDPFDPESDVVQATVVGPDGVPGPIRSVSPQGQQSLEPMAAVDSRGRATLAWHSYDGTVMCSPSLPRIQWSQGQPPEPPIVPPADPAPAQGSLRLAGVAHLRNGRLIAFGRCMGEPGALCEGRVRLVRRGRPGARSATFARGRYAFRASRKRLLPLSLSRHGRQLLRGGAQQPVKVKAEGRGVLPGTVTVLARPRRKG